MLDLKQDQFKLEAELKQVMCKLITGESHEYDVRECHVCIRVSVQVEIVQEGSDEHPELVLVSVSRVLKIIKCEIILKQACYRYQIGRLRILTPGKSVWKYFDQKHDEPKDHQLIWRKLEWQLLTLNVKV